MSYLVTGAAGFIGYHVCEALLARGESVIGIDNLNDYYEVSLKEARRGRLTVQSGFSFHKVDISDREAMQSVVDSHPGISLCSVECRWPARDSRDLSAFG
jgi:UDP-glucuronate 4-epimerase